MNLTWLQTHQEGFGTLKGALIKAPILHYQGPLKHCIVYTDASDKACRAQLSREHDGQELPAAFLSHTFIGTQLKWNTPEQESYEAYYAITKCNHYPPGFGYCGKK